MMPMDLSRISKLLERYWNCETSVQEEEELRIFFSGSDVPEDLAESKDLFRYFEKQRNATLDNKFEEELIAKLESSTKPRGRLFKLNFNTVMQIAAVTVGIIAASVIFKLDLWTSSKTTEALVEDTFKTPEEAYEETKKAFLLIAEKMNSGRVQTQKIGALNQAEEKIKNPEAVDNTSLQD